MKNKIIALIIALVVIAAAVVLIVTNGNKVNNAAAKPTDAPAATEPATEAATEPATEAPTTEAATEPATEAATEPATEAPTTEAATEPATEAPAEPEPAAKGLKIAVPNDPTNEARALRILEANGLLKIREDAGITATRNDITENPLNIEIVEVEAAMVPNVLPDVDYAVINSNYAIEAGLKPAKDALIIEGEYSTHNNILCVKEGNEDKPETKALIAALSSRKVADFITETYEGSVISVVTEPGDGFDPELDYAALKGATISVAASPTPHAEVLKVAAEILAEKEITLNVIEYADYVQPNMVVDSGEVFANYFQHTPYLINFNQEQGTHVVSVLEIHVEPMGLYGGQQQDLNALNLAK